MRSLRGAAAILGAAAIHLAGTSSAGAQIFLDQPAGRRGAWSLEVAGQMANPVGDFRTNVDRAWGAGVGVRYQFGWLRALGLRADLGILNYGNERKWVPLSPTLNRVIVEMNTSNNIALITAGPELAVRHGRVRPYVHAFGGYSHFYTESSASDERDGRSFASSVNFSDGGGAAGWGGGVRVPLRVRRADVALDAGARFTRNWTRSYLRPGDVHDQPDGSLRFTQRRTAADFWQLHLGASITPRSRWR